jgi:hypothetical protein
MRAFTILRLRALGSEDGRGFAGQVVCDGQSEGFRVRASGATLALSLAGQDLRLPVDPFVAQACRWPEIGETVRAGIGQILNSPRYTAERRSACAA